jgi:hypothetical protein
MTPFFKGVFLMKKNIPNIIYFTSSNIKSLEN